MAQRGLVRAQLSFFIPSPLKTWEVVNDQAAPLMEKRIRWYQRYTDASWRVGETYVKVAGQWAYLYRAIDKNGDIIDFMLSPRRTAKSARRFLGKALKLRQDCPPETIKRDATDEANLSVPANLPIPGSVAAVPVYRRSPPRCRRWTRRL